MKGTGNIKKDTNQIYEAFAEIIKKYRTEQDLKFTYTISLSVEPVMENIIQEKEGDT
jgi:hypothetical protein